MQATTPTETPIPINTEELLDDSSFVLTFESIEF